MACHWDISASPDALISVAASSVHDADSLQALPPQLLLALQDGMAKAATAMKALVFTGGRARGAGGLIGRALSDYDQKHSGTALGVTVHLVGFVP
eukprot:2505310-Prymnesium_polylepis.1